MNLSTVLLGALIIAALVLAIRRIWRNIKNGKADCCGCTGCGDSSENKDTCGCGHCNGH